jgi:hypothetical protein
MRVLKFTVPVLVALLLASCGDDSQPETAAPTTTRATSDAARFCEIIADDTGYLEGLERVVPKDMASGAAAAESLARLFAAIDDEQADPADFPVDEVSERLAVDGVDESLDRLADKAAADCDDEDAADAIRMIATFGAIVSAPKDDGYCSKLEASIRSEGDSEDPSRFQREISNLAEAAPEAHRRALEEIAEVVTAEEQPPDELMKNVGTNLMGLGFYAEYRCGIKDALGEFLLASALLGDFGGGTAGTSGNDEPATPADATAANAALPPGSPVSFGVREVELEDPEDGYRASAVVPLEWTEETTFRVTFRPPDDAGMSILTDYRVSAGCDGLCEPTDWEKRLRGPEGFITNWIGDATVTEDRAPAGSAGAVITTRKADGEVRGGVFRWDDQADRYFACTVELQAEDSALLPAFVAACEAARTNWIFVS